MTEYTKEIYRNWGNVKFLQQTDSRLISISNKIRKDAADSPYINFDMADFVYQNLNHHHPSDEDLMEHVEFAVRCIRKGDVDKIFEILKEKKFPKPLD